MYVRIPVAGNMFILFQKPFEHMPHGIWIQNKSLHKRNIFCLKVDKICLFSLPVERESPMDFTAGFRIPYNLT